MRSLTSIVLALFLVGCDRVDERTEARTERLAGLCDRFPNAQRLSGELVFDRELQVCLQDHGREFMLAPELVMGTVDSRVSFFGAWSLGPRMVNDYSI
ncbi:MAG: hypothetical protein AB7T08_13510, partial [Hyphomonadaceae bacterium]